jgi:hypothetical protein
MEKAKYTRFKLIEGRNFTDEESYNNAVEYYKKRDYRMEYAKHCYMLADCCTVLSIKGGE